jgi:hypothetical protein
MRKLFAFLALTSLVVVVSATAQAQRFGGGQFQTPGYTLLTNKSVQEELKLSDEQKEKIKGIVDGIRADTKGKGGFGEFKKDMSKEEMTKLFEKMAEQAKETNTKAMKQLLPLLKEEQVKRFKEIERQQMRTAIFTDADFAKEVGITDDQKEKIKGIVDEIGKDSREIQTAVRNKELDLKDGQKKIDAIRKDGLDRIMEVMKDEQKAKYKALMGETFEVKFDFGGGFGNFGKGKDKKTDKDK